MKHSSQAATTAAQSAEEKRGSNWIQTQFGNEYKYYLRNGCVYAANLFASGALLQTFLSAKGLSGAQIGTVTAALSMAQTVTILLFSTVVDKVRNSLRTSAKLMLLLPLFSLVMLPFSLMEGISADVLMAAVLIAGAVQNIFYGLYVILDYRIPYEIIDTTNVVVKKEMIVMEFGTTPDGRRYPSAWDWRMETNIVDVALIRLNGHTYKLNNPVRLSSARETWIVGPGVFDAAIECVEGCAKVRLENCLFNNRSKIRPSKANILYELAGGVCLNFTEHEKGLERRDFVLPFDGAYNDVRFKGPETIEECNRLRQRECKAEW